MSRVIGVFSGKGGVGKTTVVANLGAALTNVFNKNILIFDSNIKASHLGFHLGIYNDLPVTLREVLTRKVHPTSAIYVHPTTKLNFLSVPLVGDDINLTEEECCNLINEIKNNYDIVIIDCPPGLGKEVIVPAYAVDEAIVVTTSLIPAVTDAMRTIRMLNKLGKKTLGIVINKYRNEKYQLTPAEISSACQYETIAIIPEDKRIPESISEGIPAVMKYPYSPASIEINKLAAHLIGEKFTNPGMFQVLKTNLMSILNVSAKQPKQETYQKSKLKDELTSLEKLEREIENFSIENKNMYFNLRKQVDELRTYMIRLGNEVKRIKESSKNQNELEK